MTKDGIDAQSLRGVLKVNETGQHIGAFKIVEYHTAEKTYLQGTYSIRHMHEDNVRYYNTLCYDNLEPVETEIHERFVEEPVDYKDLEVLSETPLFHREFKAQYPIPCNKWLENYEMVDHEYKAVITSLNTKQGVYYRAKIEYSPQTNGDARTVTDTTAFTHCYLTMKPVNDALDKVQTYGGAHLYWEDEKKYIESFEYGEVHKPSPKEPGFLGKVFGGKKP